MSLTLARPALAVARTGLGLYPGFGLAVAPFAAGRARPAPPWTMSLVPRQHHTAAALHAPPLYIPSRRAFTTATTPNPSSSTGSGSGSGPGPEEHKSAYQRFKDLTKTYGSYAILMYLALSVVDFSLVLAVIHTVGREHIEPYVRKLVYTWRKFRYGVEGADALEAADAARVLADVADEAAQDAIATAGGKKKPQERWWQNRTLWAEAALAYPIHKIGLLPIRAGLTVAWTPKVVHFLRSRGWIGTSGAKRAAQHGAGRVRDAGQRAMTAAKGAVNRNK